MPLQSRREIVFLTLAGFFITNAVLAEMTGGKLIDIGPFIVSVGVLPWPIVFLTTDLINEYYGRDGVRKLTWIAVSMILFAFAIVYAMMQIPATSISPVKDDAFNAVFSQSIWIVCGSMVAFITSQLIDVSIFWFLREKTGEKKLWLRATGSTVVSQLIDTFIVGGIAFYLPGKLSLDKYIHVSLTNYTYKLIVAVAVTPIIYAAHSLIDSYLGEKDAHKLIEDAAKESI